MDENGIPSGNEIGAALSGGAAFIEKLDQATGGWWAVHKAKRQVKAAEKKMKLSKAALDGMGIQLTDDEMRGIAFSALQEVKGFENLSAVIARVAIPENAPAGDIEDEWMSRFVECSKEAFSEWKRAFLADIANAKASDPASLSIGALNCIARMEAHDVETMRRLRSITPEVAGPLACPIILFKEDDLLSLVGLDVESIERLRDIGVLHEVENRIRFDAYMREPHEAFYDGKPYMICSKDDDGEYITLNFGEEEVRYPATRVCRKTPFSRSFDYFFDFGLFSFTPIGRELLKVVPLRREEKLNQYLETAHLSIRKYEARANDVSLGESRDFKRTIQGIVKDFDRDRRQ